MTVSGVFAGVSLKSDLPPDLASLQVSGLEYDSRRVEEGNLFFAFEGQHADGRRFAMDAIRRGAVAVVSQSARPADFPTGFARRPLPQCFSARRGARCNGCVKNAGVSFSPPADRQ